jgi:two-component system response regulator NreC
MAARPPGASMRAMTDRLRIVLADDHAVVRAGVRRILEEVPGWSVVAECGDTDAAVAAVRAQRADVLVLDLAMPGRPSLAVLQDLPDTHVVVLTMEADPAMGRRALAAGAAGYVLKEAADTELVAAVRCAAAGGAYLDPSLGAALAAAPEPARELSAREAEVLRLIALGNTNTEAAELLGLSVRTVETHRGHILDKTGCRSRAELVLHAIETGLLDREFARRRAEPLAR